MYYYLKIKHLTAAIISGMKRLERKKKSKTWPVLFQIQLVNIQETLKGLRKPMFQSIE